MDGNQRRIGEISAAVLVAAALIAIGFLYLRTRPSLHIENATIIASKNESSVSAIFYDDSSHKLYAAGTYKTKQGSGAFVIGFDSNLTMLWMSQPHSSNGKVSITGISAHEQQLYVAGWISGTGTWNGTTIHGNPTKPVAFVGRLDSTNGKPIWIKTLKTKGMSAAYAIDHTRDAIFVSGSFLGSLQNDGKLFESSPITYDAFVARISKAGKIEWIKTFTSSGRISATSLAADKLHGILFVGGELRKDATIGNVQLVNYGCSDIFIASLKLDGTIVNATRFGDRGCQNLSDLAVNPNTMKLAMSGFFNGSIEFGNFTLKTKKHDKDNMFVAMLDEELNPIWARQTHGKEVQRGYGVTFHGPDLWTTGGVWGEFLLDGNELASKGYQDVLVAGFSMKGEPIQTKLFGDSEDQFGYRIVRGGTNVLYVGGTFAGKIEFENGSITSMSDSNGFLLKIKL